MKTSLRKSKHLSVNERTGLENIASAADFADALAAMTGSSVKLELWQKIADTLNALMDVPDMNPTENVLTLATGLSAEDSLFYRSDTDGFVKTLVAVNDDGSVIDASRLGEETFSVKDPRLRVLLPDLESEEALEEPLVKPNVAMFPHGEDDPEYIVAAKKCNLDLSMIALIAGFPQMLLDIFGCDAFCRLLKNNWKMACVVCNLWIRAMCQRDVDTFLAQHIGKATVDSYSKITPQVLNTH